MHKERGNKLLKAFWKGYVPLQYKAGYFIRDS